MLVTRELLVVAVLLEFSIAAPREDVAAYIKTPDACKGKRYCTVKPEGYDRLEDTMNKLLPKFLLNNYADRYGPEIFEPKQSPRDDWDNCPYETKLERMYHYYHGENNTKVDIVIQTKMFTQMVETVNCLYKEIKSIDGVQCFKKAGVIPGFDLKSSCEQSNAKRTIYVFDPDRNKIIQKYLEVPACCSCKVCYKT